MCASLVNFKILRELKSVKITLQSPLYQQIISDNTSNIHEIKKTLLTQKHLTHKSKDCTVKKKIHIYIFLF